MRFVARFALAALALVSLGAPVVAQSPVSVDVSALSPALQNDVSALVAALKGTSAPAVQSAAAKCVSDFRPTVFDVTHYGADPKGVADSTVAIRRAQAAAEACAGTIYFPAGTYAVCPQPTDPAPATTAPPYRPIFTIGGAATWSSDGAATIRGYMPGLADPATTWTTTGQSYFKIARFGMFSCTGGLTGTLTFQGLTFDGGAPATGNYTVGGIPATGDGWDMTHKCWLFGGGKPFGAVVIKGCTAKNWRGEICYASLPAGATIALDTCTLDQSNADAVSCSAAVTISNSTIGPNVFQGCENQAVVDQHSLTISNSTIGARSNAVAWVQNNTVTKSFLTVSNTTLTGDRGLSLTTRVQNVTFTKATFNTTAQACIMSGGWCTDSLFDTCTFNGLGGICGQGQGWTGLTVRNCTVSKSGAAVLSGSFASLAGSTVTGSVVAPGACDVSIGLASVAAPVVSGTVWQGVAVPGVKLDASATDTALTVYPTNGISRLNGQAKPVAGGMPVTLSAAGRGAGFTTTLLNTGPRGVTWVLPADPKWNTWAAPVTIPAGTLAVGGTTGGVNVRVNAAGLWELAP
jgi:hypothetical protein